MNVRRVVWVFLPFALHGAAGVEAAGESEGSRPAYWECIKPDSVNCIVLSEADQKKCPLCTEWKARFLDLRLAKPDNEKNLVDLIVRDARYRSANVFMSEVGGALYDQPLPQTRFGFPITVKDVQESPDKYGWRQTATPEVGSFVIVGNTAGLVVDVQQGEAIVLYPSGKLGGKLTIASQKHIGPVSSYVLPKGAQGAGE